MKNKALWFGVAVAIVLIATVILWLKPSSLVSESVEQPEQRSAQLQETAVASNQIEQKPSATMSMAERIQHVKARRNGGVDLDLLNASFGKVDLFQQATAASVMQRNPIQLGEKQLHDGRQFINYDPYSMESKIEGDRVKLQSAAIGLNVQGVIDRVEVERNNDTVRWYGHIEGGDPNNHTFTIAQALKDSYMIGTIHTGQESYSVEAKNGAGWIMKANTGIGDYEDGLHAH